MNFFNLIIFNIIIGNTHINNTLIDARRIQDIYRTEKPKKRYTIIHPDGRIEEFDQVDGFFDKNPNYVVVKFEDIMKQIQEGQHLITQGQFPVQENKKITVIKNKEQPSDLQQINRENNAFKEINNTVIKKVINNSTPIKTNTLPASNETNNDKIVNDIMNNDTDLTLINSTLPEEETNYVTMSPEPEIITLPTTNLTENNFTSVNTSTAENNQPQQFQNDTNSNKSQIEYEDVIASNVLFNSSSSTVDPIIYDNNFTDASINTPQTPFEITTANSSTAQGISNDTNGNETQNLETTKEINDLVTRKIHFV